MITPFAHLTDSRSAFEGEKMSKIQNKCSSVRVDVRI